MVDMQRYKDEQHDGGRLYGLEPVSSSRVSAIRSSYPWIPSPYLDFISAIGVGSCSLLNIYEPVSLESVTSHPSFELYQSPSYREAFGFRKRKPRLPVGVVMFADVGAAWRYCFSQNSGSEVLCFDLAVPELTRETVDFYEFIDRDLRP